MKIYAWLAMVLTIIGAALGMGRYVVANDRRKAALKKVEADKETRDAMDAAEITDAGVAAEFLRDRAKRKRSLSGD